MKTKKVLGALIVLSLSLVATGCRNQNSDISSQDSSLSSTTSQLTTIVSTKKDFKEFYKPVFDNY